MIKRICKYIGIFLLVMSVFWSIFASVEKLVFRQLLKDMRLEKVEGKIYQDPWGHKFYCEPKHFWEENWIEVIK